MNRMPLGGFFFPNPPTMRVDTAGRRPRVSRRGSGGHHKCEGLILYCLSISRINDV